MASQCMVTTMHLQHCQGSSQKNITTEIMSMKKIMTKLLSMFNFNSLQRYLGTQGVNDDYTRQIRKTMTEASVSVCLLPATTLTAYRLKKIRVTYISSQLNLLDKALASSSKYWSWFLKSGSNRTSSSNTRTWAKPLLIIWRLHKRDCNRLKVNYLSIIVMKNFTSPQSSRKKLETK